MLCNMVFSDDRRMELTYTTWTCLISLGHQWIERRAFKDVTRRFENIQRPRLGPVNESAAYFPTNSCMWSGQGLYTMTRSSTISDEGTDHGWNRSCLVCENLGMSEFLGGGGARLAHPKLPTVCWILYVVGGSLRMRLGISGCNSLLLGREWRPAPTRSCPGTRLFVSEEKRPCFEHGWLCKFRTQDYLTSWLSSLVFFFPCKGFHPYTSKSFGTAEVYTYLFKLLQFPPQSPLQEIKVPNTQWAP